MKTSLLTLIILFVVLPSVCLANAIPAVYTDSNFKSAIHEMPVSFNKDSDGNFAGVTTSGKVFTQTRILFDISIKLQKFTIDDVSLYISSKGTFDADSDLQALSIALSSYDLEANDFQV